LFAERVRVLESKLPHLQQKLGVQNGNAYDRQNSQVQHSLVGRVEALEEALDVLITAQVGTDEALCYNCCDACHCKLQACSCSLQAASFVEFLSFWLNFGVLQEQQLDTAIKDDGKTKCSKCCIIM